MKKDQLKTQASITFFFCPQQNFHELLFLKTHTMQNFVNILIPYSICLHMSKQKTKSTFLIYFTRWIVTQASVQNQNVNPFSDAYRPLMSKSHLHDILVNHPHQY